YTATTSARIVAALEQRRRPLQSHPPLRPFDGHPAVLPARSDARPARSGPGRPRVSPSPSDFFPKDPDARGHAPSEKPVLALRVSGRPVFELLLVLLLGLD